MKKIWIALLIVAIALMIGCGGKKAGEEAELDLTPEEVSSKEITENAYDFLYGMSQTGRELQEGFVQISDVKGEFHEKNHYVYVYDFEGNCMAHAGDPSLRGMNLVEEVDADGNPIVRQMIDAAMNHGEGWLKIAIADPETDEVKRGRVYYKRLGDLDYVIGSGYFRK